MRLRRSEQNSSPWTTDVTLPVAADGTVDLTGFYGDYTVTVDGKTVPLSLLKGTSAYSLTVPVGDYNSDGVVDAADYTVSRDTLGSSTDLRGRWQRRRHDRRSGLRCLGCPIWERLFERRRLGRRSARAKVHGACYRGRRRVAFAAVAATAPIGPCKRLLVDRNSAGTSFSASSGSTNELPTSSVLSLIRSGKRIPGKQRDGKDFLHGFFEFQEGDDLPALDVDDPHAAGALGFLQSLGDLDAAEDGRFADLREADERQVADHFQAAGEAVEADDRLVFARVPDRQ